MYSPLLDDGVCDHGQLPGVLSVRVEEGVTRDYAYHSHRVAARAVAGAGNI